MYHNKSSIHLSCTRNDGLPGKSIFYQILCVFIVYVYVLHTILVTHLQGCHSVAREAQTPSMGWVLERNNLLCLGIMFWHEDILCSVKMEFYL